MTCAMHTHTRVGNDCVACQGHWGDWSSCSVSCGEGHQTRNWVIDDPKDPAQCTPLLPMQTRSCPESPHCPVHCVHEGYDAAVDTPPCSVSCGGGKRYSCLKVVTQAQHGGESCPEDLKSEDCNTDPCPVDCLVEWHAAWTECSQPCGGGKQTLSFDVLTQMSHNGAVCPETKEEDCNTHPCPVDCAGTWSDWSECTATCGGGMQSSKFEVTNPGSAGGKLCPASPKRQACGMDVCPPTIADPEVVHLPNCPR